MSEYEYCKDQTHLGHEISIYKKMDGDYWADIRADAFDGELRDSMTGFESFSEAEAWAKEKILNESKKFKNVVPEEQLLKMIHDNIKAWVIEEIELNPESDVTIEQRFNEHTEQFIERLSEYIGAN